MTTEMIILHNQVKYIPEIQGWVIPGEKCNSPHEHKKKGKIYDNSYLFRKIIW